MENLQNSENDAVENFPNSQIGSNLSATASNQSIATLKGSQPKMLVILISSILGVVGIIFIISALSKPSTNNSQRKAKEDTAHVSNSENSPYKEFAFSTTTESLELSRDEGKVKFGPNYYQPLRILSTHDGYAQMGCAMAQTVLFIPLGWFAYESGKVCRIESPDKKTWITMNFEETSELDNAKNVEFETVKTNFRNYAITLLENPSFTEARKVEKDLPDGSLAITITGFKIDSEELNGYKKIITPDPTYNGSTSYFNYSISLAAPMNVFPQYEKLLDLILRDRKIIWAS